MVSPRKSSSSLSIDHPQSHRKLMATSAKSCESIASNSSRESACMIYQRKLQAPQMRLRQNNINAQAGARIPSMAGTSDIHQRVMSARNLRIKTFQNQLADAQHEIANLAHENRMLRTLHKRQDTALAKYEATNSELPQLLHSHAEEIRMWQTKYRNLQAINKELEQKLKQKENLILSLTDQNKHYNQLNKDKNLEERQRLQEKVRMLEQRMQEKENDMKLMARKVQLESKNFKHQLLNEQRKSKEYLLKLEKTKLELSGYRKVEELAFGQKTPKPASGGRRPKMNLSDTMDDPSKIDKLEKSLESLQKAIEQNNDSEYTALAEGFDNEKCLKSATLDTKAVRNLVKLTLPASSGQTTASTAPRSPKKNDGSAVLSNKSRDFQMSTVRLRSVGGNAPGNDSEKFDSDAISKFSLDLRSGKTMTSNTISTELSSNLRGENGSIDPHADGVVLEEIGSYGASEEDEGIDNRVSMDAYAAYIDNCADVEVDDVNELHDDDDDDDNDDDDDDNESVIMNTKIRATNTKEEVSSIRKQLSDDYKEREAFLDTFCRQATNTNMRNDPLAKKRNSIANVGGSNHITGNRKSALLAALKAIDENKSQD